MERSLEDAEGRVSGDEGCSVGWAWSRLEASSRQPHAVSSAAEKRRGA
jgi:hypothetical protein